MVNTHSKEMSQEIFEQDVFDIAESFEKGKEFIDKWSDRIITD
jgi:hypothetical protein